MGSEAGLVDEVLGRLGFDAPPPATLAGLDALYRAWCRRMSFDNPMAPMPPLG